MWYFTYLACLIPFFDYFVISNQSFKCADGSKSILDIQTCSGVAQCDDCSDERNCSNHNDFVACEGKYGAQWCRSLDVFCDGKPDCKNCQDERKCPKSTMFFCEDGSQCFSFSFRNSSSLFCNGKKNCDDGSDEKKIGFGFKCAPPFDSKYKYFLPKHKNILQSLSDRCVIPQIYLEKFADQKNVQLCENDANRCFKIDQKGVKWFDATKCWTCLEGTIIQRKQVCDGIFDCPDLSDECLCFGKRKNNICNEVLSNQCTVNQFFCPESKKCIEIDQVCNNNLDCDAKNQYDSKGSDEKFCGVESFLKCNQSNENICSERYMYFNLGKMSNCKKLDAQKCVI